MTQPVAGATVGSVVAICYEVAGTSREPVVALEVILLELAGKPLGSPMRVDGSVGRNLVEIELVGVEAGPYDLRVQLIADGDPVDGVVVTIPAIRFAEGTPPTACP